MGSHRTLLRERTIVLFILAVLGGFGAAAPAAWAATSPSLGTADPYSVLAGSSVTNTGATTVSGNVGISPGAGGSPNYTGFSTVTLGGTVHDADSTALTAQADKNAAYAALASQGCTIDYGGVTQELAGLTLAPGVYCATSFHLSSGTLILSGAAADVWIFKSASDLIITGSSAQVLFSGGGSPCNVWWRAVSSATIDAGSNFVGNILADTSITLAAGASLDGRALARTAEVTLDSNSITGPTCTAAPAGGGSLTYSGTINVVKLVVNDNGGTKTIADFPLYLNNIAVDSGDTTSFSFSSTVSYTVTETGSTGYAATFSGDCDANGVMYLHADEHLFCILTNNDVGTPVVVPPVPPLIDIVKVPTPLALPDGPGLVSYAYTVRNIGTVPMHDVTVVDDTCVPAAYLSGDTNGDSLLDVTETWSYHCSTTLNVTTTNTVVATGWANGLSATDIATATVVVGTPLVPPLIHVTKVPSPITLLAGGGTVTYTETITNPGTVPLENVSLVDDKCSPVTYMAGDANSDGLLDVTESWAYVCQTNITTTTTNTATATGEANGFSVRDIAVATVVVAGIVPSLPNTGVDMSVWLLLLAAASGACSVLLFLAVTHRLHRTL